MQNDHEALGKCGFQKKNHETTMQLKSLSSQDFEGYFEQWERSAFLIDEQYF